MSDVHSPSIRSFNMSRIRSENTKPELIVRRFLFTNGLRYRLHDKLLPGKPDVVLSKKKIAVFIHGCFWHGHKNCRYFVLPKTRTSWWLEKINGNIANDKRNIRRLNALGWKTRVVWECQLKPVKRDITLNRLLKRLV